MPSRKLILEANIRYHIYNRGFNKKIIYHTDYDFQRFYMNIQRYLVIYDWIRIVSYCFLPNHFHFILYSVKSGFEISGFMKKIQQSYAMYKNISSPDLNKGQLFEWSFKAKPIFGEEYLLKCQSYVNYNSIKHGIVNDIDFWPYTSFHIISGKTVPKPQFISLFDYLNNMEKFKDVHNDEFEF